MTVSKFAKLSRYLWMLPPIACIGGVGSSAQALPPVPVFERQTPDPTQIASARLAASVLMPEGLFRRVMEAPGSPVVTAIGHSILTRPIANFTREVGLPAIDEARNSRLFFQILEILDPVSQQRAEKMAPVLTNALVDVAEQAEPAIREQYAQALAERLTIAQLRDLNAFLATPSGSAFANNLTLIEGDLGVQAARNDMMVAVSRAMPAIFQKITAATMEFPKPKTAVDLTDHDRRNIATLLGVDPIKLHAAQR